MKRKVILFSKDAKPRILINPPNIEELKHNINAVVDPDLSNVKDIPSQYWIKVEGEIVGMSLKERVERDKVLNREIIAKPVQYIEPEKKKKEYKFCIYSSIIAISIVSSYYVSKYELIDKAIKEIINVYQSI